MRPVDRSLSYLVRRGWRDGLFGGSNLWAALGIGAFLLRRRRTGRTARIVYSEELRPGESVVIAHVEPGGIR